MTFLETYLAVHCIFHVHFHFHLHMHCHFHLHLHHCSLRVARYLLQMEVIHAKHVLKRKRGANATVYVRDRVADVNGNARARGNLKMFIQDWAS